VGGVEDFGGGAVFHDDEETDVACPGEDAGDGAGGAVAGVAEAVGGEGGDESGGPVHGVDKAAQDPEPAGAFVGAPVLGVEEILHEAQRFGLVGEDSPSGVDDAPPLGVWLVGGGGKAGGGAAAAVGKYPGGGGPCRCGWCVGGAAAGGPRAP
jgi:hypothetical protein